MEHSFLAKNVVVAYRGGGRALRQFDLDFSGKCLGVVGGEKDGKTTLINAIAGLIKYEGEFVLDGRPLGKKPSDNNVQAILEDYCLLKRKTVRENVEYPLKIRGEDVAPAESAIKSFGLTDFAMLKAKKLPEQVKPYVAVARLSLVKRDLYLFDDILRPLSGIDKELFMMKLEEIFSHLDGMIVYATSDLEEARRFADKIAIVYGGVIEQYGTYDELRNNPLSRKVAEYFDDKIEFHPTVLREFSGRLIVRYGDENISLFEGSPAYLIDKRYIGREVQVAPYKAGDALKYLIIDPSTDKTILKY